MTRRIVLAILLVTWAVMAAGAALVYLVTRQTLLAELDESLLARASALPQVLGVASPAGATAIPPDDRYVIRNELGQTVARPELVGGPAGAPPEVLKRAFATLGDGRRVRSITVRLTGREGGRETAYTVVYSGSAEGFHRLLTRLSWLLAGVCVVSAVLASLVAVRTSRAALRPLGSAAAVIGGIDDGSLDRRIDAGALPPELAPVASRLNEMLGRLERGFAQRKRFLADAAHELRTPIAAVLTTLEVALSRPRDPAALAEMLRGVLGDVRLLKTLAEALLDQARAESPSAAKGGGPVEVGRVCEECVRLLEATAATRGVELACGVEADLVMVGEEHRVRSIVINLLSNAIEHTRAGGRVDLSAVRTADALRLSVTDTGRGIAPDDLPHLFEPFYRVDHARTAGSGHLGLGLFLVQTHARALGGGCEVQSQVGQGSRFTVAVPQPVIVEGGGKRPQATQENMAVGTR